MSTAQLPDNFWLLADPSQEVLMDGRPAFSQLAVVPLRQLGMVPAGEPATPNNEGPLDGSGHRLEG